MEEIFKRFTLRIEMSLYKDIIQASKRSKKYPTVTNFLITAILEKLERDEQTQKLEVTVAEMPKKEISSQVNKISVGSNMFGDK